MGSNKAIFLDRDGTINVEKNYLYRPKDWEWIPGAVKAIKGFNDLGFLVIVITNQAGIARGLYSEHQVKELHAFVDESLKCIGARIDAFYFCPHHPEFGDKAPCYCRKPKPGMLLQAQKDFSIDFNRSYLLGDKVIDIQAGRAAGVPSFLVETGYGRNERLPPDDHLTKCPDIHSVFQLIRSKHIASTGC